MAKKNIQEDDGLLESQKVEGTDENSATEVKEVKVTSSKEVRIHVTEEVDCRISCKPYKLKAGKDYKVPSDVAAILCYGGKAYRL